MDVRILGPLEVLDDEGHALALGGAKQRALLAILLLQANRIVSSDRLIDELWGDDPPETAAHVIQVYVSQLRKVLPERVLVTRRPGYLAEVDPDRLDLYRFEQLLGEGKAALGSGDAETATRALGEALGLWRGSALADFAFEPFAQAAIGRLDELRLVALEERIEADLALGRHAQLVPELEALVAEHPLRERLRGQLMLALYRSGRQAEALEAYQETRRALVDELGIDPSPALQELERGILRQDPALEPAPAAASAPPAPAAPERSILVLQRDARELAALLAIAEPLARSRNPHELILARLVADSGALAPASGELSVTRTHLLERGVTARVAVFTSSDPGADAVRLASQQDVDLLLLDRRGLGTEVLPDDVRRILEEAPCDVAVLAGGEDGDPDGALVVPFGGAEHDWAALELGAWSASARDVPLRLLGAVADDESGRRDASRLLASASLAVQQLAGVAAEPSVVPPGEAALLEQAASACLLVLGLSERWRTEGIGAARAAVAAGSAAPTLVVRRGPRPGGLTPPESLTRFTWSLEA